MSAQPGSAGRLVVERLCVGFGAGTAHRPVVQDLSFTVEPGRAVALVGESGSGKSVTARSLVGLAGHSATVSAQRLSFGPHALQALPERDWRALRGRGIGFVLQDALVSLDPLRPVGHEIAEALAVHGWGTRASRRERVIALLRQVGVPEPELRARQRPDQLSGGLRQRALIAAALAMDPGLLIADEPTTALDATVQAQILDLFRAIKARGSGLLIISHDLAMVSRLADDVVVLRDGRAVEQGPAAQVLGAPEHPYTRSLIEAVPGLHPKGRRLLGPRRSALGAQPRPVTPPPNLVAPQPGPVVLEAVGLCKRYPGPDRQDRLAVDRLSFILRSGQTLGIVGESGSGKTTAARMVLGLVEPDGGRVMLDGNSWVDPGRIVERQRRGRRKGMGVIYQDPLGSFDPRWTVRRILADALDAAGIARDEHAERIRLLLDRVRLGSEHAGRLPLHLSGGQRQRVAIARALATEPRVIVCDEPVSALDVSVQAQILDLLADLQADLGVAFLFISHDLGVIRHVSDEVLVMQGGRVVENGPVEAVFRDPRHPFTRQLLAASAAA